MKEATVGAQHLERRVVRPCVNVAKQTAESLDNFLRGLIFQGDGYIVSFSKMLEED